MAYNHNQFLGYNNAQQQQPQQPAFENLNEPHNIHPDNYNSYQDGTVLPMNFHYTVSQEQRNDMIRELVQIQVYVREMEETTDLPQAADHTKISLSTKNTSKNQDTAQQKEKEYEKKAQEIYQQQLQHQRREHQKISVKQMQQELDRVYIDLCKEYVKKKKEQVKNYKQQYINSMTQVITNYDSINARTFIDKFIPLLSQKIQEYETKKRTPGYRLTTDELTKAEERRDQLKKMTDVAAIVSMQQAELLKHEYLKFRIKRLEEVLPWLKDQIQRMTASRPPNMQNGNQLQVHPQRPPNQRYPEGNDPYAGQYNQNKRPAQMDHNMQPPTHQSNNYPVPAHRQPQTNQNFAQPTNHRQNSAQINNQQRHVEQTSGERHYSGQNAQLAPQHHQPTNAGSQENLLSLKHLVTKVHEIKRNMPAEAEIKTLADISSKAMRQEPGDKQANKPLTLELIERQRMERDRSGILFSNILRQVRGRIFQKESLGTVENNMIMQHYNSNGRGNNRPDASFFKTSTDQINYKQILGFEIRRDEEEDQQQVVQQQQQQQQILHQQQLDAQIRQQPRQQQHYPMQQQSNYAAGYPQQQFNNEVGEPAPGHYDEEYGKQRRNSFGNRNMMNDQYQQDGQTPGGLSQPQDIVDTVEVAGTNWFETQVNQIIQQLRSKYATQISVVIRQYPINYNQNKGSRSEELIILKQVAQQKNNVNEIMFLIDFFNTRCFWISHSELSLGANLQPNITDSFEMQDLITMLTQRTFLK